MYATCIRNRDISLPFACREGPAPMTAKRPHTSAIRKEALALYESGLSVRAVARRIVGDEGVVISPQTVARWARAARIVRPVGASQVLELTEDAIRLYESGLNIERIAERFGVGKTTVAKRLREMGIGIRPSGSRFLHALTEERLRALYLDRGWSVSRIAKLTGCSVGTVYRHLALHDIQRGNRRLSR